MLSFFEKLSTTFKFFLKYFIGVVSQCCQMAESTAIFHEYGGTENLMAVSHGIYLNVAEIWRFRKNYNLVIGTQLPNWPFGNLALQNVAVKFLKWRCNFSVHGGAREQ